MPTIILVRPGCTDFDEQNRIQGSLDLPLNDLGEDQVRGIVTELRGVSLVAIYAAPDDPARSTAERIGKSLALRIKESDKLRNLDYGLWQGLLVDEVRRKYPKVFKQWKESPETICPPKGESVEEAVERVEKALQKPLKKKCSFAVVASEPLASVVSCVVRKKKLDFTETFSPNHQTQLVEYLQTEECDPAAERPVPEVSKVAVDSNLSE